MITMIVGVTGVVVGLILPPLFPVLATLYVSALVLGSTFHFFFITVQGIAGGMGGSENRARNFALVGMGSVLLYLFLRRARPREA